MTLSQTMSATASPEDSLTLSDRMAQIKAAFEALERNATTRKRALEDGLEQVGIKGDIIYKMSVISTVQSLYVHVYLLLCENVECHSNAHVFDLYTYMFCISKRIIMVNGVLVFPCMNASLIC